MWVITRLRCQLLDQLCGERFLRHRMGRALRQAHVQSEHRNASVWRSADSKVRSYKPTGNSRCRILRPILQPTLDNTTKEAPRGHLGRNRFTEREATVGPKLECDRKSLCATRFRISGVGLATCWRPLEVFVGPCPLFVSNHAAVGLPPTSICYLLSCPTKQGRRRWEVRCVVPCTVLRAGENPATSYCIPRHQEAVIVEVECTYPGDSEAEGCCYQVQLDRIVSSICIGPQWSALCIKKRLVTVAGSPYTNLNA